MPSTCVLKLQMLVADEELVTTVPSCSCCLLTCNTSFTEAPFPVQNAHFPLLAIYKYTFLQNKSTLTLVKVPLRITRARPPLPASSAHAAICCGDSSTLLRSSAQTVIIYMESNKQHTLETTPPLLTCTPCTP